MKAKLGSIRRIAALLLLILAVTPGLARSAAVVSVLDLNNNAALSQSETSYLTDLARDALARNLPLDHFTIMTRESILELLPEGTRLSDCLDASCEVEMGRTLGADYVVSGEVLLFAGEFRLILKVHHCNSAAFIGSEKAGGVSLKDLENTMAGTTELLAQRIKKHSGVGLFGVAAPLAGEPVISLDDWIIKPESGFISGRPSSGKKTGMVRITAGEFLMGSPRYEEGRGKDEDRHQVTLTQGFLMSATEVTQDQWYSVMGSTPSRTASGTLPVENITFSQCVEYCNALSKMEGLKPAYGFRNNKIFWNRESTGYRLPTEAEWEYSCRAGSQDRFTNGNNQADLRAVAWFQNNSTGGTQSVGSRQPNEWGLYDMHGNVWEWCWNWSMAYPTRFAVDPEGPDEGYSRVIRGGAWDTSAEACRSANHNSAKLGFKAGVLGFRVVRTVLD